MIKFDNLSLKSKYSFLVEFFNDLNKFKKLNKKFKKKKKTEKKKTNVLIISSKLYNNFLEIYYDEYNDLSDPKKRNLGDNYDPER